MADLQAPADASAVAESRTPASLRLIPILQLMTAAAVLLPNAMQNRKAVGWPMALQLLRVQMGLPGRGTISFM
jgi:hypothetical protein